MTGIFRQLRATARLMVGQPCYDDYVRHMAEHHPDRAPMSRVEYFRDREQARFGGRGGGKCC